MGPYRVSVISWRQLIRYSTLSLTLDLGRLQRVCRLWRRAVALDRLWAAAARQLHLGTAVVTRAAFVANRLAVHCANKERGRACAMAALEALGASHPVGLSLLRPAVG